MHTKRGWFCSFSVSNLPTATCRHRGARTIFSLAFRNHVLLSKVRASLRGWLGPARPLSLRPLHALMAVSLFTHRENCERPVFCRRITLHSALSDGVVERHLTMLEIYGGTSFFQKVRAQQTHCLRRDGHTDHMGHKQGTDAKGCCNIVGQSVCRQTFMVTTQALFKYGSLTGVCWVQSCG